MLEGIGLLARRLCACGLLCALAMALVKDSGQQAVVRLCCASLTVIAVFTALPSLRLSLGEGQSFRRQMEEEARLALEQSGESQRQAACQGAEDYLKAQAEAMGVRCQVSVQARLEKGNLFCLEQAEYRAEGPLTPGQRQGLLQAAGQLGLTEEQTIIREGEQDEE